MSLATDLVLLTTDPATGRSMFGSNETGPVLGGALLVDLVLAERVEVDGPPRRARVRLVTGRPVGSAPHDRALALVRPGKEPRASSLVPRLGKGARAGLLDQLRAEEALAPRTERALGIFPVTRHDVVDVARRERVLAAVRAVLLGHVGPDEVTGPLVGLLHAGGVVKRLVAQPERRGAVRRAKEVAKGDWAGSAARAAVVAASQAATAAVSAAVAVSVTSDGGAPGA
ncbi:Golgi phosphoprotein 3 GPP34 [Nocardioides sp. J9]|uniref:GOLPH3/VPS74 family protein n=1 Tax=unclassified Nocardioides TaxID=2615069 RepID=UPI0004B44873|nr:MULTISPECIES: GPP34 family phosphoprotein [unclassified Nocardioides]TWG94220.1 Golgi phosphoprotein 3 GPP34 [Nocardioides sp. J9]